MKRGGRDEEERELSTKRKRKQEREGQGRWEEGGGIGRVEYLYL